MNSKIYNLTRLLGCLNIINGACKHYIFGDTDAELLYFTLFEYWRNNGH